MQIKSKFLGFGKSQCDGFPMQIGSKSEKVKEVQTLLGVAPDGAFGSGTEAAAARVLGTKTVSCDQYKKLAGKGITPQKIEAGVGIASSIFALISANKNQQTAPVYAPVVVEEEKSNTIWYVVGGIAIIGLVLFIIFKK